MKSWKPSACVPCAAASWASPRPTSPTSSASAARRSAAGGPPTADGGLDALPHDRTGRPVGSGRALSDAQADHIQATAAHPPARGVGHRRPAVDPPRRRRPDPPGVRRRPGGADRRPVSAALGLHAQAAASPRPRPGPRGGAAVAGGDLPGHRAAGGRRRGPRSTGATRSAWRRTSSRRGATPRRGEPATMDVPDPHIRANQISAISNAGQGPFHDLHADDDRGLVPGVFGAAAAEHDGQGVPDRGPAAGAHDAGRWRRGWRRIASGWRCSTCRVTRRS